MCLPGIIDSEILSGIFSAGSRCLYSFSNKQTSLKMHTAPIILTGCPTESGDPSFLSMNMGSQCAQAQRAAAAQAFSSLSVSLGTAQHDISTGCSTLKSGWSLPCHVLCISILGCLLTQSKALNSHSLSPSQKAVRDSAKLLTTFWKKSVVKK